jgi:hypothetical protein
VSTLHVLRIAQYWDRRITPLLSAHAWRRPLYSAELAEAIGWLIEGVFCGYFKPDDADLLWVRLQQVTQGQIEEAVAPPRLLEQIRFLQRTSTPFKAAEQMVHGRQRNFELPLFGHALLLADRFAEDSVAVRCTIVLNASVWAFNQQASTWDTIEPAQVVSALIGVSDDIPAGARMMAAFIKLLEHMQASQTFIAYARGRANKRYGVDFDAYTERVASLNGWRVPLMRETARRRFEALEQLLINGLRSDNDGATLLQRGLRTGVHRHVAALKESWELAQLSGFLAKP